MESISKYDSEQETPVEEGNDRESGSDSESEAASSLGGGAVPASFIERCKFIPVRLSDEERAMLAVLENALNVSEYTDNVDVFSRKSKLERILEEMVDVLTLSCGLTLCSNLTKGENLLGRSIRDNIEFFQDLFEIGRRYKIMNPDKMRETYGKMMFMLQDSQTRPIRSQTGFTLVKPIKMVYSFLRERNALALLADPLIIPATTSIEDDSGNKSRQQIADEARDKRQAAETLRQKYRSAELSEDEVQLVIDSISDNNNYLSFNVRPVDRILKLLQDNFDPNTPEGPFSLELQMKTRTFSSFSSFYGNSSRYFGGGAKLSHDHRTQFTFVFQSFSLWREIMHNLPKLWFLADQDLLSETGSYHLSNTGQGLNRVQYCPNVGAEMRRILSVVHHAVGPWVGLSVVHLGDRDVPNALVFIDKYTQVPRILAPIASCVERLDRLCEDPAIDKYIKQEWSSVRGLRLQILSDFFKHGFDGSGDDGGSCIDGRLTSAWNWCSKLSKKPYYYVFMLAGFQGFDGDWKS